MSERKIRSNRPLVRWAKWWELNCEYNVTRVGKTGELGLEEKKGVEGLGWVGWRGADANRRIWY